MKVYYDLHLHSCLSPCGDQDMTPNNIVNMASILGLDIIALTDHNSCKNCEAAVKAGERVGVVVVPGMELCTAEEIHVVCLFPNVEQCERFDAFVHSRLLPVQNRTEIYGEQTMMDDQDQVVGYEDILLITAADISINDIYPIVKTYGGTCYPAHIDRDSYSILSSLGDFPPDCHFNCAEIADIERLETLKATYPILEDMPFICSSDAHYLENMQEKNACITLEEVSAAGLIAALENPKTSICK